MFTATVANASAMMAPIKLTVEQQRRFDEDGFFLVEDALTPNEISELTMIMIIPRAHRETVFALNPAYCIDNSPQIIQGTRQQWLRISAFCLLRPPVLDLGLQPGCIRRL